MLNTKMTLQTIQSGLIRDDVIMLGEAFMRQWKLPANHKIHMRFGSHKQQVTVVPIPRTDGIRISQSLTRKLGLIPGNPLRAVYKSGTLTLGPLIGVLISRDEPDQPDKPFGSITMFCKELVDASRVQGAMVCFFTPEHIEGSMSQLKAWVYSSSGWQQTILPIPDVINNRLLSRKSENQANVQHFMKELKTRYNAHIFNEKFLDKTEVFDALSNDLSLARYLPESHLLRNFNTLKTMCVRYPTVFLKPVRGSLGKGIIRISRLNDTSYQALYTTVNGTRRQSFTSLTKLYSSLSTKMKTNRYQLQQGLTLMENAGRPVDFRALVQKNATGKWTLTSIVARTASVQHFVSNLARGGTLSTVKDAISKSNLTISARQDIFYRLQQAALDIARGIESNIPFHFGELGIDLAVDSSGHIWLLEVNSKPSKNDNTPLKEQKIRPSVRKLIDYCRYLSGF
ncbi:YheC/YheD family endospore coat-associated protein [Paenibacillus marinisediminis]